MEVFVIGGKSGSGKGKVSELIKEYYDLNNKKTIITEFSKYLKLYAYEMLGSYNKEEKPRKFLQDMGEKIRNDLDKYFLINRMKEDILVYQLFYDNVVIADARMIEEIEEIKNTYLHSHSIYISSTKENKLTGEERNHITETQLSEYQEFDYYLEYINDEQLKMSVFKILDEIEGI